MVTAFTPPLKGAGGCQIPPLKGAGGCQIPPLKGAGGCRFQTKTCNFLE